MVVRRNLFIDKRKPKENQKKPTSERRQMALSRGGAEGRTAGPLGFGPHLRPLCGPPLQQQHDFWSSPVSVVAEQVQGALRGNAGGGSADAEFGFSSVLVRVRGHIWASLLMG